MSVIYIVSSNGILSKEGLVLYYKDHTGLCTKILPDKVSQLVVLGDLEITGQALHVIMMRKIPVDFLQKNGMYNGKLVYQDNKNTLLRHQQHVKLTDKEFLETMAKDIVRGKLHNEYLFLQRIARKIPNNKSLENGILAMDRIRQQLEKAIGVEEIRGFEGQGAHIYFSLFGLNILPDWVAFHSRNKNPPLDPVNSVLSFLYTVLANRIDSYISREGLDSSVGSLHALSYGRKSLVFDLIEEYRTPIVDTLVCSLFNLGIMTKEDFRFEEVPEGTEEEIVGENILQKAVLLTEKGMRKVIGQFEKKLADEHQYPLLDKTITYDGILRAQVNQYKQVISGLRDHYIPLVVT